MTADPPRPPVQPPTFWLSVGAVIVFVLILGVRLVTSPDSALGIAILVGLSITALIIGGFALSISGRMRRTHDAFPNAIHMPIVVGPGLAVATAKLSESLANPTLLLRSPSYATLAVNATGLHVVTDVVRPNAAIAARSVSVAGIGSALSGSRMMWCILLDVETTTGVIQLPVIPMRLRNPLRMFTADDMTRIADEIRRALAGEPVTIGWPY